MRLGCGSYYKGNLITECEHEEMRGKHRKVLGKAKLRNHPTRLLTEFLATILKDDEANDITSFDDKKEFVNKTAVGDRDLILIDIATESGYDEMENEHICEKCKEINEIEITLSKLPVKTMETPETHKGKPTVTFKTKKGATVLIRIPLVEDTEKIEGIAKENPIQAQQKLMDICMVSHSDFEKLPRDISDELKQKEINEIQNKWNSLLPGVEMTIDGRCWSCRAKFKIPVDISSFLFGTGDLT